MDDRSLTRRRLFELGATTVGLAAVLAACGNDEEAAPGRVGNAPSETDFPAEKVDDAVYLRTLTSLEHSIVEIYAELLAIDGLGEDVAALLQRFSDDHLAAADTFASLTSDAGGEPYECANSWLMRRSFQPVVDHIIGTTDGEVATPASTEAATGTPPSTEGETGIPPTDDADRDSLATADAFETVAAATAQQYVERLADPALRAEVILIGAAASRRAATAALRANPPPEGYVSPALTENAEVSADEEGFLPQYAISSRFGQLTPVTLQVGALDELGQRFTTTLETPADNAYVYHGQTCEA